MALAPFAIFGMVLMWAGKTFGLARGITLKSEPYGPPAPPQTHTVINQIDLDTLARTMWGEARGEGAQGMQAVANVIMNRYRLAQRSTAYANQFGRTVTEICKKPWQFSCWNANDPNRQQLLAVTTANAQFNTAREIANRALHGTLPDITGGADHYHTKAVRPAWSTGVAPVASLGSHVFFRLA